MAVLNYCMNNKSTQEVKTSSHLSVYLDCNLIKHSSPLQSLTRTKKFTIKRNPKSNTIQKERNCFSNLQRNSIDLDSDKDTIFYFNQLDKHAVSPAVEMAHLEELNLVRFKSAAEDSETALQKIKRKKKIDSKRQEKIQLKIMKDFHPYVQNVDTVKLVLAHLRPVKGPNQSTVQSIGKYKQDNLENVEVVMKNLKFSSFEQAMEEYVKRIGAVKGSFIYIMNSKERNIRNVLEKWGWIQNKNRNSNYYHLKWVCNDLTTDYKFLQYGQYFNHFDRNKELTNKNSLQKNLRKNAVELLMPETFDIESYEQLRMFQVSYERQLVFSFIKYFLQELDSLMPSYNAKLKQSRHIYKSVLIPVRKKDKLIGQSEHAIQKITNLFMQPKRNEAFLFPIEYLVMICRYSSKIIDQITGTETKGIFTYNNKEWAKNRGYIHHFMSYRSNMFRQNSIIGTPSALLIRKIFELEIVLSVMLKREWVGYGSNNLWIVKPVGVSRGSGITIHRDKDKLIEASKSSSKLIQKYIEKPLIFRDVPTVNLAFTTHRKFDIRQWVLVTSTKPMEAYKFDKCYVRLCSEKYQLNEFRNTKQHLTNYSQNKFFFSKKEESVLSQEQFKIILGDSQKWRILDKKINNIILKTLNAVDITNHPSCFELYGFDVIIDEHMEPWLLEVNLSPACQQRTEWMSDYIRQMSEGLLRIVLPGHLIQKDPRQRLYRNHWRKLTEPAATIRNASTGLLTEYIQNNDRALKLLIRLQLRWLITKKYKLGCQSQIKNYKKVLLQQHNPRHQQPQEDIELSVE